MLRDTAPVRDRKTDLPEAAVPVQGQVGQLTINRQVDKIKHATKLALDAQTKYVVEMPTGTRARALDDVMVGVNGYIYQIQRGKPVEVPETVYQQLLEAGRTDPDYRPSVTRIIAAPVKQAV